MNIANFGFAGNIPTDLTGYVPTSRTITINGVTYDLSANRTWNVATGMTNPMTTAGDIIVGGSSGTPNRLGIGGASQILASNGSTLSYVSASPLLGYSHTQNTSNNTAVEQVVASKLITANSIGNNDTLIVRVLTSFTNSANTKTMRIYLAPSVQTSVQGGSVIFFNTNYASQNGSHNLYYLSWRNSATSIITQPNNNYFGNLTASPVSLTYDNTTNMYVIVSVTKALGSETFNVEALDLQLLKG
jgi:hypothetical protein